MRFKHLLSLCLFFSISLSSTAMTPDSTDKTGTANSADDSDSNALTTTAKPIVVSQGSPRFSIRLAANAGTGFQWFLFSYDHDLIHPVRSYYQAGNSKLMGIPGVSIWEFEVKRSAFNVPQVTHLEFEYRRPWEARFGDRQAVIVIIQPSPVKDK